MNTLRFLTYELFFVLRLAAVGWLSALGIVLRTASSTSFYLRDDWIYGLLGKKQFTLRGQ